MLVADVDPRSRMHRLFSVSQVRASSPRPLERRVSFCDVCVGEGVCGPPDEPRKSFMKFCVTDAIPISARSLRPLSPEYQSCPSDRRLLQSKYAASKYLPS